MLYESNLVGKIHQRIDLKKIQIFGSAEKKYLSYDYWLI